MHITWEQLAELQDIIKDHDNIFLKMDIEGSEYDWINNLSDSDYMNMNICIFYLLK